MVYILLGQDTARKNAAVLRLTDESVPRGCGTQCFDSDICWGHDATLAGVQEALMRLPAQGSKRMVVIKEAQDLKPQIRDFLAASEQKDDPRLILVLDFSRHDQKDPFLAKLMPRAKVLRTREEARYTAFDLSRHIESKHPGESLLVLHELLRKGERPELIMGALRSACERRTPDPKALKKKIRALLACDSAIKTGRSKPVFALERLVVILCSL
jgi:hypothetical protein